MVVSNIASPLWCRPCASRSASPGGWGSETPKASRNTIAASDEKFS